MTRTGFIEQNFIVGTKVKAAAAKNKEKMHVDGLRKMKGLDLDYSRSS